MGDTSELAPTTKEFQSRNRDIPGMQPGADAASPNLDPFLNRLFHGAPAEPPEDAARYLSVPGLKTPVLQRAQRAYGNRASQQFVMRARGLQRQCACGGTCPKCQEEEQRRTVQRKSTGSGPEVGDIPTGGGQPLDVSARRSLEDHFQSDLSDVQVHTDSEAAKSAARMDALAYAAGRDLYFAAGMYSPASRDGQRLLAHEVAHVVQQSSGMTPGIAEKPAGGVVIGAPDDPLEAEADRAAEDFMNGTPSAGLAEGKRMQGPPVHRFIQRESPDGLPGKDDAQPSEQKAKPAPKPAPAPQGDVLKSLNGVQLVADEVFMRYQLEQLILAGGGRAPGDFLYQLEHDYNTDEMAGERAFKKQYEELQGNVSAGVPRSQEDFEAYDLMKSKELKVLEVVRAVVGALDQERSNLVMNFENTAKERARTALETSEKEERSQALLYGIDWKTVDEQVADCLIGDCTRAVKQYSMGEQTPAVTGLQGSAKVLLQRREDLDAAHEASEKAAFAAAMDSDEGASESTMERFEAANQVFKDKLEAYNAVRGYLSGQYPILAALSDPEKSSAGLKSLVDQKAGPGMAALLGKEIVERLDNIEKVRGGLDDRDEVNIWRLPHLVEITSRGMGADANPIWAKWIEDQVSAEKPGLFGTIALLLLNVAALALAGPTGGASLVVAAGVNAVVAVEHIKDYQWQKALSGTAFDKANALSQQEPSLFWLAFEIVGVAFDAAAAFKAVAQAVKAVQAAREVRDAARVLAETEKLESVASHYGGEAFAKKVVAQVGEDASAESRALKALNATDDEIKLVQASERELDKSGLLAEKTTATGGKVKVDKAGRLWACSDPCQWAREKFVQELAADQKLNAELAEIEGRLAAAAKPPGNAAQLAQAEADGAAFYDKIARSRAQATGAILGKQSVVIDTNTAISLNKRARGLGLTLDEQKALGVDLNPAEQAMVNAVDKMGPGADIRVADITALGSEQVRGGVLKWKQIAMTVDRRSTEYKSLLQELETLKVGRAKGVADREIVADTFFSISESGVTPTLATHDPGIYNPLAIRMGYNPARQGVAVAVKFPTGFPATVNGRTIHVLPLK